MPDAVDEEEVREGQVHWHLARMYMTGELVGKPKEEDKTTDPSSFYNAGALNVQQSSMGHYCSCVTCSDIDDCCSLRSDFDRGAA